MYTYGFANYTFIYNFLNLMFIVIFMHDTRSVITIINGRPFKTFVGYIIFLIALSKPNNLHDIPSNIFHRLLHRLFHKHDTLKWNADGSKPMRIEILRDLDYKFELKLKILVKIWHAKPCKYM